MKNIDFKFMFLYDKSDWTFNIIPFLNFGNQVWGKGFCINIGWGFWNIHIGYIKTTK